MWRMDKILKSGCDKLQRRKNSKKCIERGVWQLLDMSIAMQASYFIYPHP